MEISKKGLYISGKDLKFATLIVIMAVLVIGLGNMQSTKTVTPGPALATVETPTTWNSLGWWHADGARNFLLGDTGRIAISVNGDHAVVQSDAQNVKLGFNLRMRSGEIRTVTLSELKPEYNFGATVAAWQPVIVQDDIDTRLSS